MLMKPSIITLKFRASGLGVSNSWAGLGWFYSEHAFNLRNVSSLLPNKFENNRMHDYNVNKTLYRIKEFHGSLTRC